MEASVNEIRARLHWKNRKTYSLIIPPSFLQGTLGPFPRTNQICRIRSTQSQTGKPVLFIEFE